MKLLATRYSSSEKQTIGILYLLTDDNIILQQWDSLELAWLDNQTNISCIPLGKYKCKKIVSASLGKCLEIQNVPNRTYIRIHSGNFYTQILGCMIIGNDLTDINNDGYQDVIDSRDALEELLLLCDNELDLEIRDM